MPTRARESAQDVRKTVTVLFADIVDSSRLSQALDPEALRDVLARYFGEFSAIVGRHGGTVEKYIGDALMAVFGVPVLHEDDALRAVRAAAEMRDSLATLNGELEAAWGVRLADSDRRQHRRRDRRRPSARAHVHHRRRGQRRQAPGGGGSSQRDPDRALHASAGPRRGRGRAERAARARPRQDDPRLDRGRCRARMRQASRAASIRPSSGESARARNSRHVSRAPRASGPAVLLRCSAMPAWASPGWCGSSPAACPPG